MKNIFKAAIAAGVALIALSANANAQTSANVDFKALGSSGIFLELGLGASSATAGSIHATCIWSGLNLESSDNTTGTALTDTGNAWAAWTPAGGTCAAPGTTTAIYAYLQTDSVVGNRCLFDGSACNITDFPTTDPASAGLFNGLVTEVSLPTVIANALNSASINAAGTDIRPEDAEFATARARFTPCGAPVATGSQYLGLGYSNGANVNSSFTSSVFHVISFTLPTNFVVTPVGVTPIVVVVNGSATTGLNQYSNISSPALAKFLDGTYSYSNQAAASPAATGDAVNVLIREPLSGTYNTMEYNVPNSTVNKTSQDVGVNQPQTGTASPQATTYQANCTATLGVAGSVPLNPNTAPSGNPSLYFNTLSGGHRARAIGTGQELSEVRALTNSLGYGFWSVANFSGFSSTNGKYLMVDSIDPLLNSSTPYSMFNGTIPLNNTSELASVDLHSLNSVTGYPIWSLLRLVTSGSTAPAAVTNLASAAQQFVSTGTNTSRPDFIVPTGTTLTVLRSHFVWPGQTFTAADGHVGLTSSNCTVAESGGDVGGVVLRLTGTGTPTSDNTYCGTTGNPHQRNGQTGMHK